LKIVAVVEYKFIKVFAGVMLCVKQIILKATYPVQFIYKLLAVILVPFVYLSKMSEGYLQQYLIVDNYLSFPRKGCIWWSETMVVVGVQSTVVLLYHLDMMERDSGSSPAIADWI
jgi:hypothetical protein